MDNVLSFPTKLDKLADKIKHDIDLRKTSREAWIAATLDLCLDLAEARAEFPANSDFGRWLNANGIELNGQDRAAAVDMGQDPKRAAEVLAATERHSLQYIHKHEFRSGEERLSYVRKTPGVVTKARPISEVRLRALAAYDAVKASGQPLTYDAVKELAGCGGTAVRAAFIIRQADADAESGEQNDLFDPKASTKRDEARAIVRPLIEAGQPVSLGTLHEQHGLSERAVREAIIAERGRVEGLREAQATAPIDTSILSASAQAKFAALEKRLRRELSAQFDAAVAEKCRQWCEDIGLTAHRKEMDALKDMLTTPRTAVMHRHEYRTILMALHPDGLKARTDEQLAEAFRLFTHYKLKMVDDEEERIEARRKLRSNMPGSLAEMLARKTQSKP